MAPAIIRAIKHMRLGPTVYLRNNTPIKAANNTDVSRKAAAIPMLSKRVAIMTQLKLRGARTLPASPLGTNGGIAEAKVFSA
jgi:hypothetical protein